MNFDKTQREKWEGGEKKYELWKKKGGGESGNLNSELQVFEFYLGDKTHTPLYYIIYTYTYSLQSRYIFFSTILHNIHIHLQSTI